MAAFSRGAEGDRTPDLVNAIHALSQLSYSPGKTENEELRTDNEEPGTVLNIEINAGKVKRRH